MDSRAGPGGTVFVIPLSRQRQPCSPLRSRSRSLHDGRAGARRGTTKGWYARTTRSSPVRSHRRKENQRRCHCKPPSSRLGAPPPCPTHPNDLLTSENGSYVAETTAAIVTIDGRFFVFADIAEQVRPDQSWSRQRTSCTTTPTPRSSSRWTIPRAGTAPPVFKDGAVLLRRLLEAGQFHHAPRIA